MYGVLPEGYTWVEPCSWSDDGAAAEVPAELELTLSLDDELADRAVETIEPAAETQQA